MGIYLIITCKYTWFAKLGLLHKYIEAATCTVALVMLIEMEYLSTYHC